MPLFRIFRCLSLAALVLLMTLGNAVAEPAPRVIAKVGGVPITVFELQREFQSLLPLKGGFHTGVPQERVEEIRQEAMDALIEQAYKVRYALQEEIAADNAPVEKHIAGLVERFGSEKALDEALGEETLGEYRASIYRKQLAKEAEQVAVGDRVQVTEEEVKAFYDRHEETYMRPQQFKASHILVKVDPASNAEEKKALLERAEDLAARAQSGEDFYNLAYYNSDDRTKMVGGDIGYFHKGQTAPEFEAALLELEPGEISDPVKTMWGYHIIKLVEVNEPRQMTFDEMRPKIRQQLEEEERQALYDAWMGGLKEKYTVERFDQ